MPSIARQVVATGTDAAKIASRIVDELAGPDLRLALVFADWRLDPAVIASATYRGLRAPVVGGGTTGVIGRNVPCEEISAVGIGFYGDWLRVGIGVAPELPKAALARSRDAVQHAATMLGTRVDALDANKHVGISIIDGTCGHEEAFCIGSAAAAPKIRFVGGCTSTEQGTDRRALVWVNGEVLVDAGVVLVLASELPFYALTSAHLVTTDVRTVVTAVSGRMIDELDGRPATTRLRELVRQVGDTLAEPYPQHSLARYIDGFPYVRSILRIVDERLGLASAVETGHVLRVMRPGDLIGVTQRDLAMAAQRVGGEIAAFLAFSCMGRHIEAKARSLDRELAGVFARYPTVGFQTSGEQSGMLLVNHSLTGLAIGEQRSER
ncbi:MAG: FIST N-terminal domain-containing protein [Kofleriaceae bacterium]|nr:FIST N-terminal domain-containing protein [Kofleriaceae bacterium]